MAENATNGTKTEIKQPENPVVLNPSRNGVTIKLVEQRTTRGQNPGKTVFDPCAETAEEKENFLKHIGLDNVYGIVRGKYRQLTLGWVEQSTVTDEVTEEQKFIEPDFIKLAETFDASGETMADLEEAREEQMNQLTILATKDMSDPANVTAFTAAGQKIAELTRAINAKSRPRKKKAEVAA